MASSSKTLTVAFPIPTTSRGQNWRTVTGSNLFRYLYQSFLKTFSPEFKYRFYLGIDPDDPFYSDKERQEEIKRYFTAIPGVQLDFVVMENITKGHLTKMWNLLCQRAYDDGCDYFYFCGDDIEFTHKGWVNKAVELLSSHDNLGFTGPTNLNGNTFIITQTFVARKHFDIFGYAYPEEIWNWYCDDWVNLVYSPDYIYRMDKYQCYNQGGAERYAIYDLKDLCHTLVAEDKKKIEAYLHK